LHYFKESLKWSTDEYQTSLQHVELSIDRQEEVRFNLQKEHLESSDPVELSF